jgi:hypothetical protein
LNLFPGVSAVKRFLCPFQFVRTHVACRCCNETPQKKGETVVEASEAEARQNGWPQQVIAIIDPEAKLAI